ncbi:Aminopeptidase N [compost metagenome]
MRRPLPLLLAALLLATPVVPAAAAPAAPAVQSLDDFTTALRDSLHSGDLARVRKHFHVGNDRALVFLAARWDDMRAGRLDPVAWEVTYDPYFGDAFESAGQLSIAARRADGSRVGHRFDVALLRRGDTWLVGEPIRYDKPETRLAAHDLLVDLRRPGELAAQDTMTLEPTGPDRHVFVRLHPSLRVSDVTANGVALPFVQRREVLYFQRPDGAEPSHVTVRYAGMLPVSNLDFVRPESAVLRSEFLWYPRPAIGGSFVPYSVAVKVSPGQQAIAVGEAMGVETTDDGPLYRFASQRPVEGMSVYAGRYQRFDGTADSVTLSAFMTAGDATQASGFLSETARVLKFYGDRYGRYPYKKLAVVATDFPGGYGATSAVALPHLAFERPSVADEYLSHEIAHNWTDLVSYGGTLGERGFMAEGVASYLDLLYHLGRDGAPGFRKRLQAAHRRYSDLLGTSRDVALAAATQDDRGAWQALTYDKGAIVLHMLRREVGDKAFDAGLKALYSQLAGQEVTPALFQAAFEKASGQNLGYFFRQWLTRAGAPVIVAEGLKVVPLAGGKFEVAGELNQRNLPFVLTVPLVVVSDKGQTLYQVPVRSFKTPFRLNVPGRPRALLIDPLNDALLQADGPIPLN